MSNHSHALTTNLKALKLSAVLILIYFVFEILIAIYTGSLTLMADAGHELSTFVAILISLAAIGIAMSKPTTKRTFGHLRVEVLAAFLNGLLLLGMAAFIIIKGVERIFNPMEVPSLPMFIMAFGGIGLEITSLIIMYKGQKENLNIRGSFWHVINAFLGSLAVIIAAIFISFWKIYTADAWIGIFFAIILIIGAYGIIKDSINILLDATPKEINLNDVERDLESIEGVSGSHHFHARTISGNIKTFSGHLVVENLKNSEKILKKTKQILEGKYRFALTTIQLENSNLPEMDMKELEYK